MPTFAPEDVMKVRAGLRAIGRDDLAAKINVSMRDRRPCQAALQALELAYLRGGEDIKDAYDTVYNKMLKLD